MPSTTLTLFGTVLISAEVQSGPKFGGQFVFKANERARINRLKSIWQYATNEKCTKAFNAIGATPPKDQFGKTTVATENIARDKNADGLWQPTEEFAAGVRQAPLGSVNDVSYPKPVNGWMTAVITNRGFSEKDDYLSVTFVHALIHTGGIGAKDDQTWWEWFWGIKPHDLRYLGEKYDKIIEECTREGKSRAGKAAK